MCPPLLFGSQGAILAGGTFVAPTAGLIGFGGQLGMAGSILGNVGGLSTLFSVGSFGMSAFGALRQGQVASNQAEYQANVARYNAQVAENNAAAARFAAEADADVIDDRRKRIAASADTVFAKSNVVINTDTPLAIQERIATEGAMDRLARLYQGETEAAAHRARATGQLAAAGNYIQSGRNAVTASRITATGKALKLGESLLA